MTEYSAMFEDDESFAQYNSYNDEQKDIFHLYVKGSNRDGILQFTLDSKVWKREKNIPIWHFVDIKSENDC